MSDRVESFEPSPLPTRREFTLDAALALLAGCVVTISEGCGKSSTSPTTTAPPVDVPAVIQTNHNPPARSRQRRSRRALPLRSTSRVRRRIRIPWRSRRPI